MEKDFIKLNEFLKENNIINSLCNPIHSDEFYVIKKQIKPSDDELKQGITFILEILSTNSFNFKDCKPIKKYFHESYDDLTKKILADRKNVYILKLKLKCLGFNIEKI